MRSIQQGNASAGTNGRSGRSSIAPVAGGPAEGAAVQLRDLSIVAGVCGVFGIAGWIFYGWAFHRDLGQDWMVFYTAARSYLDGDLALIFHGQAFTAALNRYFAGWLRAPLNLHPWVYPPTFLLLFLPFGLPPAPVSFALFLLAGFLAALAAVWFYTRDQPGRWLPMFTLLLCPAAPFNVMTGQNAFYTSALLVGGFGLLGRAPLLAGALLGMLSFKPQLCLMVPVALIAARRWRALAGAGAMALALALASAALFGIHSWLAWIELVTGRNALYRAWLLAGRLAGTSIFAYASWLGAASAAANLVQAVAAVASGAFVYWIFRRRAPRNLQLSALFVATLLAAPHASDQDGILLGLAASLFLLALPRNGHRSTYAVLAAAVWVSPLVNPPALFRAGLITPVLLLLFLAALAAAVGRAAPPIDAGRLWAQPRGAPEAG